MEIFVHQIIGNVLFSVKSEMFLKQILSFNEIENNTSNRKISFFNRVFGHMKSINHFQFCFTTQHPCRSEERSNGEQDSRSDYDTSGLSGGK